MSIAEIMFYTMIIVVFLGFLALDVKYNLTKRR